MAIGNICTRNVATTTKDATVLEAAQLMRLNHVGDVVVVEKRNGVVVPIGILTDRDIVVAVVANDVPPGKLCVRDVMTYDLIICHEKDDIYMTINLMKQNGVKRIPVTNEDGSLIGIISSDDLLSHMSQQFVGLSKVPEYQHKKEEVARPASRLHVGENGNHRTSSPH